MKRYARKKEQYVPKLDKIEVSQKNIKLRWVTTIAFLAVGVASLAFALSKMLTHEIGWMEIEITSSYGETCADEFVLMYQIGVGEESPATEKKAVASIYTESAEKAYKLFHGNMTFDGVNNLALLNQNPNEIQTVDPALYDALLLLEQSGLRHPYLGPAYEVYNGIFGCQMDQETVDFDPLQNEGLEEFVGKVAAFAADTNQVELELLGDNRVQLRVDREYLAFADENDITCYFDFYWMKNAFIADYIAQELISQGYTNGVISSYDGYSRNLDGEAESDVTIRLFDRVGTQAVPAAVMRENGTSAMVYLQSFPVNAMDQKRFYSFGDGQIRVKYLDIADGLPKTSTGSLAAYSKTEGCASILLRVLPGYVCDEFPEEMVTTLKKAGVDTVYLQDGVICHTSESAVFDELGAYQNGSYIVERIGDR